MIFDKVGIENAKYIYIKKVRDKYIYIDNKFNEKRIITPRYCITCRN